MQSAHHEFRVSLISLNQVWEDKKANRAICEHYIRKSSEKGSTLVVFPEMTLTGFTMNSGIIAENSTSSETMDWFCEMALRHSIAIIFGVVISHKRNMPTNNLVAVSSHGEILVNYSKIHLFRLAGEDQHYSGGEKPADFELNGVTAGAAICYDLRFPELYRHLAGNSRIIFTIANWPAQRNEHWSALLRARAIENQIFICGVNRTGTDGNGISYLRSSCMIDPMGNFRDPEFTADDMDIYSIKIGEVSEVRKKLPFFDDRDPRLYMKW